MPRSLLVLALGLALTLGAASASQAAVALGSQQVEPSVDFNSAGVAEAFKTTASGTGTVTTLSVYVDATSQATSLVAGLYASAGTHPGALLGQGSLSSLTGGAWNVVTIPGVLVTSGTDYWIAVLSPSGAGTVRFRDRCCRGGSAAETSSASGLTTLPASWATGSGYSDGPLSAFGSTAAGPVLAVSPATLSFSGAPGGASPASKTLSVTNGGSGSLSFTAVATSAPAWLAVAPAGGSAPATLTVSPTSTGLAAGTYNGSVVVTATGAGGSPVMIPVTLTLTSPDTSAPTVAVTTPASGSTVSGTVTVTATASDDVGVAGVQFKVDGANLGAEDTQAPFSTSWDSTAATNGAHSLSAVARDAAGNSGTAAAIDITVQNSAPPPSAYLVGNQQIETKTDSNPAGSAEAFREVAAVSGTLTKLTVYVDSGSQASQLVAGIYADSGGHPGLLLGQGTLGGPVAGAWNEVSLPATSITGGAIYWIAILSPGGAGTIKFRDRCCGGGSAVETSSQTALSALPSTWATGGRYSDGPASVWGGGSGVALPPADQVGRWSAPVSWPIVAVHMVLLPTGNVLMFDGFADAPNSERIWNPTTGTFTPVPYGRNLFCAGHVTLADGRTLIVGGHISADLGLADTTIYDPSTGQWSRPPDMSVGRWYPTATELADGRVLVFSGDNIVENRPGQPPPFSDASVNSLPEVFDPATNRWTDLTGARLTSPLYPFMFLLSNGKVFDAGPDTTTRILDPATWTWSVVGTSPFDGMSAVMYRPNKIMKSGAWADPDFKGVDAYSATPRTAVIDMGQPSPAWRETAPMAYPRSYHNMTLLPDGTVLATGGGTMSDGVDLTKSVLPAEIWNPDTETWTTVAAEQNGRLYHSTALLLPDGRVLMAGGGQLPNSGAVNQYNGEIYSPPYLFKGARPTITSAPALATYGSTFTVTTPDAARIASVSLIRTPAVTHAFDQNQRFQRLTFTQTAGGLSVQAPANANLAPPGYYMLFLVDTNGVPSVASMLRLPLASQDLDPPTAPGSLSATVTSGNVGLTWTAATDTVGVTAYDVYRSTTAGFTPSLANRVAQVSGLGYQDTGLAAGTYYYRVRAEDAAGNLSPSSNEASATVTGGPPPPPTTFLAGDQAIEAKTDSNVAGLAEAYRTTASTTGTLTRLTVYVDSGSQATKLVAGIYSDSGGKPGTLLAQGTLLTPAAGAWNDVTVPSAAVTGGATYWIALLSPSGTGTLRFRDRCCGGGAPAETSSQTTLAALPATWTTGARYNDGPFSAWAGGTIP